MGEGSSKTNGKITFSRVLLYSPCTHYTIVRTRVKTTKVTPPPPSNRARAVWDDEDDEEKKKKRISRKSCADYVRGARVYKPRAQRREIEKVEKVEYVEEEEEERNDIQVTQCSVFGPLRNAGE